MRKQLEESEKPVEEVESDMEMKVNTDRESPETHSTVIQRIKEGRTEGGELLERRLFGEVYRHITTDSANFLMNGDLTSFTHNEFIQIFRDKNNMNNPQAGSITSLRMAGDDCTFMGFCGSTYGWQK